MSIRNVCPLKAQGPLGESTLSFQTFLFVYLLWVIKVGYCQCFVPNGEKKVLYRFRNSLHSLKLVYV